VKIALIVLIIAIALLVVLEVALRLLFGFGNPLIYVADEQIGYLLAPEQRTRRFGRRIQINQFSQRSQAISPKREPSTLRVLLLGDSIANGGWWTDQEQTISSIITGNLTETGDIPYTKVEVLNASANSWAPRNELAYLQRFGTFESQAVVLLLNTDDLFGTAPTSVPVGRDRYYPSRKPPLGIIEAYTRLLLLYKPPPEMAAVNAEKGDRVGFNLEAIAKIQEITTIAAAKFLLVMTPLLREVGAPGPRDYEIKARSRLTELTSSQEIEYIDFLPIFNDAENSESLYRDHIHLSPAGNQMVSQTICYAIRRFG